MTREPKPLRFVIPGPPVGLEHTANRKGGGRRNEDKSRDYMEHCGTYAMAAIAEAKAQADWPYEGDVFMDLEIYHAKEHPRPDPENVAAAVQDGFTRVLWMDDKNVLPRVQLHWWPGKNVHYWAPNVLYGNEEGRDIREYLGGVCVVVRGI